jgi:hypothetical protein
MGQAMDRQMTARAGLAAAGGVAGLSLYLISELAAAQVLAGRPLLAVAGFAGSFFAALLAMSGPIALRRAALGAGGIALAVMALLVVASLGFVRAEDVLDSAHVVLGAVILTLVPVPFWIAAQGPGWRDYGVLFAQSWGIVVRMVAAFAFTGLVWAVIFLSDALLQVVGLDLIDRVINLGPMPWLITGGVLGLALAVVQEMADYVSPYLLLRLLRLLLPVVAVVVAVFLVALPLRGISGLFGSFSFALTILAMAGAVATLITTAVDQDDSQAAQGAGVVRLAQAMALMLPVLAGLGAWAVWLRVADHGWTPSRVFAAEVAALALGYGLLYALAVLRGAGWRARVRDANVTMALALLALAALAMTPVLSAERLSVGSLMARLEDGRLAPEQLEVALLDRWGRPGAEARALLEARAAEPGQEALARVLAQAGQAREGADPADLLADLAAVMPLQPPGAAATRDLYLATLDSYRLGELLDSCKRQMPGGGAGCVMVVADLAPDLPGEEAVVIEYTSGGFVQFMGFRNDAATGASLREVLPAGGVLPQYEAAAALIRAWQLAPPAVMPAPIRQLNLPEGGGLIIAP